MRWVCFELVSWGGWKVHEACMVWYGQWRGWWICPCRELMLVFCHFHCPFWLATKGGSKMGCTCLPLTSQFQALRFMHWLFDCWFSEGGTQDISWVQFYKSTIESYLINLNQSISLISFITRWRIFSNWSNNYIEHTYKNKKNCITCFARHPSKGIFDCRYLEISCLRIWRISNIASHNRIPKCSRLHYIQNFLDKYLIVKSDFSNYILTGQTYQTDNFKFLRTTSCISINNSQQANSC